MKIWNKGMKTKETIKKAIAALLAAAFLCCSGAPAQAGRTVLAAGETTGAAPQTAAPAQAAEAAVPGQAAMGAMHSTGEFKDITRMYSGERTEEEAAAALPDLPRYEHELSENVSWMHLGGCWIEIPDYCMDYVEQPEENLMYFYAETGENKKAYVMLQAMDFPSWTQDRYYELEYDILAANLEVQEPDWYVDCGNTTVGGYSAHITRMFRTLEDGTGYEIDMCFFFNDRTKQLVYISMFSSLGTEYSYHSTFREIVKESEKDPYAASVAYEKPAVSDADLLARIQKYEADCTAFAIFVSANGIPAPSESSYKQFNELKTTFYTALANLKGNVNADYLSVEDTRYFEALKEYAQTISDFVTIGYVADLSLLTIDAFLEQE